MLDNKPLFYTVIERIFSNWTALQLVVEHGQGSKNQAIEFCHYMTDVMFMNEKPMQSDIAAVLEDYMYDIFDTELEDQSHLEVAEDLIAFHKRFVANDENAVKANLETLSPLKSWLAYNINTGDTSKQRSSQSSEQQSTNHTLDVPETSEKTMEVDCDGWTVVNNKKR